MLQNEMSDPMTILQNHWYNFLIKVLGVASDMFQISQPSPPIAPSNDIGLWSYQNVIPPASLTFNRCVYSDTLFFNEYVALVSQIEFPESAFEQIIGEQNYKAWLSFLDEQNPPPPPNDIPTVFRNWAMRHAPSVANQGAAALSQMVLIQAAQQALLPYQGINARPPDFDGNYASLLNILANSPSVSFLFDSSQVSGTDNVQNTWTGGVNFGFNGLWFGSSSDSRLTRRFAASQVTVNTSFNAQAVWTSTPGSWYNSSLLNMAYSNKQTPPWPPNPNPTWEEFFGSDGSLNHFIAALVVVDEVNATVTSNAIYCETDQQTILSNTSKGLWPFYVPSSDRVTNTVTFNADNTMTIDTVTQPRNPLVIGQNVLSLARWLGHSA
ncbi:hypothetical protein [Microcoleus sp. PH2017_02_FOX_O_A]|uniref:hypothetical protein n=2 Tax=Microcoleus TaxID=44471 RepID=UPI001D548878|nr:hypothetical protein [Microcoleus sp. PH2017_02_FOX_O_A]TAG62541.1 MAG: hypothetical protein EAZ28_02630 [Oscillatoriales cyanobacterium]